MRGNDAITSRQGRSAGRMRSTGYRLSKWLPDKSAKIGHFPKPMSGV
jgi:hypothetical protein